MQLEPLRKELENLLKLRSGEERKAGEVWGNKVIMRQKIESKFEELQQLLNEEKRILFSRLEEEEEKILQRIQENVTLLEEQSSSFKQMISEMEEEEEKKLQRIQENVTRLEEVEEKSQQPAAELLKDVKDTLSRCNKLKFPEPKSVSTALKMNFQLTHQEQLIKLITDFGGLEWWMERGRYAADVTLDPETAHPQLDLSKDLKCVRRGAPARKVPDSPKRFDSELYVLGHEGFTTGRHYWEVE
ncbi:E3 ubiquitin-protein ligase TRIM39-like, partial [Rhinatrema bivittatum]